MGALLGVAQAARAKLLPLVTSARHPPFPGATGRGAKPEQRKALLPSRVLAAPLIR